ncbi:MAG: hypothetical protein ACD_78C00140G0002 [uncultured bacterium (gcode 4)]|uniref:Uncharacterized protein n=1 Tax=uncultured bacterium (gcode 4) TaxID=1234023 RepID=K1XYG6_9BACT|nr:MAG: hypothetical protein ACD_78C00140G0002 [uncultured bacterium (gcode 4)]
MYGMFFFSSNYMFPVCHFYGNFREVYGAKEYRIRRDIGSIETEREIHSIARLNIGYIKTRISLYDILGQSASKFFSVRIHKFRSSWYGSGEFVYFSLCKISESIENTHQNGCFLSDDKSVGRRGHFYLCRQSWKYCDGRKSFNPLLVDEFETIYSRLLQKRCVTEEIGIPGNIDRPAHESVVDIVIDAQCIGKIFGEYYPVSIYLFKIKENTIGVSCFDNGTKSKRKFLILCLALNRDALGTHGDSYWSRSLIDDNLSVTIFREDTYIEYPINIVVFCREIIARKTVLRPNFHRSEINIRSDIANVRDRSGPISVVYYSGNRILSRGQYSELLYIKWHHIKTVDVDNLPVFPQLRFEGHAFSVSENFLCVSEPQLSGESPDKFISVKYSVSIRIQSICRSRKSRGNTLWIPCFIIGSPATSRTDGRGENGSKPTKYRRQPFPKRNSFRWPACKLRSIANIDDIRSIDKSMVIIDLIQNIGYLCRGRRLSIRIDFKIHILRVPGCSEIGNLIIIFCIVGTDFPLPVDIEAAL